MYLIVIGWVYVVLMMSVAEASSSNGTLLGALLTLVIYGVIPVTLVLYLMGSPARNKAIKKREAEQLRAALLGGAGPDASVQPDAGGHAAGAAEIIASGPGVAPVRKIP